MRVNKYCFKMERQIITNRQNQKLTTIATFFEAHVSQVGRKQYFAQFQIFGGFFICQRYLINRQVGAKVDEEHPYNK